MTSVTPIARHLPYRGLRRTIAAQYIGVSPTKFDEMVRDGRMPQPFHVDKCVIWDVRDLDRAFDDLKEDEPQEEDTWADVG